MGIETNLCRDGWEWNGSSVEMRGDGRIPGWGWVGTDITSARSRRRVGMNVIFVPMQSRTLACIGTFKAAETHNLQTSNGCLL